MINFAIGFVIAGIVAYIYIAYFWPRLDRNRSNGVKNPSNEESSDMNVEKKRNMEENLAKLEKHIAGMSGKIKNNDVEKLLGVSDATAERDLQEMENRGLLKQIGTTGKHTHYEKI